MFIGSCCFHLQGEVTGDGEKMGIDIGVECKWTADATSQ